MQPTLFKDLLAVGRRHWKQLLFGLTMLLVSNLLLVLNPLVFRQAVKEIDASITTSIAQWVMILIAITAASAYFKYRMRLSFIVVSRQVETDVRGLLFSHIQAQTTSFFNQYSVGELMSRLTNDISAYRDVLGPGVMYPLYFLTLVIPSLIALFTISVPLALISMVPIFLLPLLIMLMETGLYTSSLRVQESLAEMSAFSQEHYSAIRLIKCYTMEKDSLNRFKELCKRFFRMNLKLVCLEGIFYPLLTGITRLVTVLLVIVAGGIILKAWYTLSGPDFISFMWIQSFIFVPVLMLGWVIPLYERGRAAYARLYEVYSTPLEMVDKPDSIDKVPPHPDLELRHLSFTYPGTDKPVLSNLSLKIPSGTFLGITGPLGAGKSTLFKILQREYEIPPGHILIGGKDIHDYTLEALNAAIVSVEQNPFLFSKTIGENVSLGNAAASQEALEMVAEQADIHETILSFPEKYATLVGERGVTLSGGQKQRIAIARALLVKRSIFLLDDIFSAVDFETEKKILAALRRHFVGKTVLLITHRVTVLDKMDKVIYLHQGKIVEEGTPEELVQKQGRYAALKELQL